jgi:ketosteroid isomerase-like protein
MPTCASASGRREVSMAKSLKETIQEVNNRYAAALSRPGAPGAGAFFTEDADLLPPGPDNFKGAAAAQAFWAAATEVLSDARLTTEDVAEIGGDAVREIGTYAAKVKATGDAISGKYVFIWRKVDGDWKIWTDIWTSHRGES